MFEKYLPETFRIKQPKMILTEGVWKETNSIWSHFATQYSRSNWVRFPCLCCIDFAIKNRYSLRDVVWVFMKIKQDHITCDSTSKALAVIARHTVGISAILYCHILQISHLESFE
ncbi:hypothetical protein BC833DRAFT_570572 [Globomyces pollinis-pini]|nr:hypothetical protein BC833DRAFT_570572 [Globomyces pollinis-pini]